MARAAARRDDAAMRPGRLLACVVLSAAALAQTPTPPDSVARLIDLAGLPLLQPGVTCRQYASTDPSGRGEDHGHFLRRDGDRCVLAEMQGPGVIARLWSANAMGRLRIFFDGEAAPRIDAPFQDLFTGKLAPFQEPIATHVSGGWISYFPIPYQKSCRVEVDQLDNPAALYYQVQYLTYPSGTPMRTFTPVLPPSEAAALQRVLHYWQQPGESPVERAEGETEQLLSATMKPGETKELFASSAPGTIVSLRLSPNLAVPALLRGVLLTCTFDGVTTVQAPLGDLFACGFGATPFHSLAFGWDAAKGGYLHFLMPYHQSACIALHNASGLVASVDGALRLRPGAPAANAGALHAEFRAIDGVGKDLYEFAHIDGPGKYVGIAQAMQGVGDLWYLEGNEEFFVDGEQKPSILGTGSEDFYNGGWYWDRGTFALPLHGLGIKQEWTTNRTTPWRLQVPDAVPFERGLVARIEHGSRNEVLDGYYSSVTFWYGPPHAVRAVADSELQLPRLWVFRPQHFVGASELQWQPQPEMRTWEELTTQYRGLDRPLFQAFPTSYVERDKPAVDARVAVLGKSMQGPCAATFQVSYADRYRLQLRLLASGDLPLLKLDGKPVKVSEGKADRTPLRIVELEATALTAGAHQLEFAVPLHGDGVMAFDSMRLISQSPFVRTWRVSPPVPAKPGGTVEDAMPEEAKFLAADFDPEAAGWKLVQSEGDGLDLIREVSNQGSVLAYLMVFVHSDTARTVRALLGSDDGARVWSNGELRWSHEIHRPIRADEDHFDLPLRAGWNRLLLKVKNDYGGYGVMLRVCDPDGTLRFAGAAK